MNICLTININKATPIKCLDLDDISGHLKLEGWLYNVLIFYALFSEEAPFYKQFVGRGGAILLVILERRPHFIGLFREEAPFYWVNLGGGWWGFFIYVQNHAGGWLEFHFMLLVLPGGLVISIKLFYWCGLNIIVVVQQFAAVCKARTFYERVPLWHRFN